MHRCHLHSLYILALLWADDEHLISLTRVCWCACVFGYLRVCSNVFAPVSQESARCVKSPGAQHTPTDDPDTIPETVSSPSRPALQSGSGSWDLV